MCMRTHKVLAFSRPCFEFISKRTVISTTCPIHCYLTLVSQNWNASFRLVVGVSSTDGRARHGQRTAPLTCHRPTEQNLWWALLWGRILSVDGIQRELENISPQVFPIPAHGIHPGHITPLLLSTWCPKMYHTCICQGCLLPVQISASLPTLSILDLAPDQPFWPCFRIMEWFGLERI